MQQVNLDTEQQLLGGLIFTNSVLFDLDLEPDDFSHALHSQLYRGMKRLYADKQSFTVADFTDNQPYVRALADGVILPTTDNLLAYAETLKELSRKRKILDAIKSAEHMLANSSSMDVLSHLQAGLTDSFDTAMLKTAEEVFGEIVTDMEMPPVRYATGLPSLDAAMGGGMFQGFTYGLAGAEKSGKTTFAHTISHNLSEGGCRHLYVALEMGSKQIEQKNLARKMGINSLMFLNNAKDIKNKIHGLAPNKNTIYMDAPGADLNTILTQVGIAKMKYGIKGFIIDYWQLVEGKDATEEKHLRNVAQGIANFARKQKLWCLLLAQRNAEGKLFGGGGLKKACDQLYFIETINGSSDARYLTMDASRYTPMANVGSEIRPSFFINKKIGPFVMET